MYQCVCYSSKIRTRIAEDHPLPSLVPRPTLAPSQNRLAHEVEFLGFMGGAMSLLIDYSRCEMLYKGLLRSLH